MESEEEAAPHIPQNKRTSASKLRRGGKNCPVCLAPLPRNAKRTKLKRECAVCFAHPSVAKKCLHCSSGAVWENKTEAACQACGRHGEKSEVIRRADA